MNKAETIISKKMFNKIANKIDDFGLFVFDMASNRSTSGAAISKLEWRDKRLRIELHPGCWSNRFEPDCDSNDFAETRCCPRCAALENDTGASQVAEIIVTLRELNASGQLFVLEPASKLIFSGPAIKGVCVNGKTMVQINLDRSWRCSTTDKGDKSFTDIGNEVAS